MTSGEDQRALTAIRIGNELHDEDQVSFWDEFISLCGSTDGLSELLGVSRDKIQSWPNRIKEMRDQWEKHTAESPSEKPDQEVLPTGDNGAFTTNVDPSMGNLS